MKKQMVVVCLLAIGLLMGGFASPEADAAPHMCFVPYNLWTGSGSYDWQTGIHITAFYSGSETFTIRFFSDGPAGVPDKEVDLDLADHPGGWTGTILDLFDLPEHGLVGKKNPAALGPIVTFTSPSRLYIYSTLDWFTVSQFTLCPAYGYGFQTFYSWPYSNGWIYPPSTVIDSEPLSQSQE